MKRLIFLLITILGLQFCTDETAELDNLNDQNSIILDSLVSKNIPLESFLAEYYSVANTEAPIASRIEKRIRHNFNSILRNEFALIEIGARWTGDFNFKDKEYTFNILTDKSLKVIIDGELVYGYNDSSGRRQDKVKRKMNGKHMLVVEYNLADSTDTTSSETTTSTEPVVEEETDNPTVEVDWTYAEDPEIPEENQDSTIVDQDCDCVTAGGIASDSGLKTWCWSEIPVPPWPGDGNDFYLYEDQIKISNSDRWYENQIVNDGDRLKFHLDPTITPVGYDPSDGNNYRAEIRTAPWDVRHPVGTEEWFGWSYTFGEDYIIDQVNKWVFFQVHNGIIGESPQVSLNVYDGESKNSNFVAGKILVINNGNYPDYNDTGIIPQPGQTLDIVVHAIWADENTGLLQVWIDDKIVYDKQVSTIYPEYPWGGNAKWGIYHPRWRDTEEVQKSLDQGISHVETFLGPLRMITRYPGDPDYGKDSYDLVKPR